MDWRWYLWALSAKATPSCPLAQLKDRAVYPWGASREQGLGKASKGERVCRLLVHWAPALLPQEMPRGAHLIPADVGRA